MYASVLVRRLASGARPCHSFRSGSPARLADIATGGGALLGGAPRCLLGVLAAHAAARLAAAACADVALALTLLLVGPAFGFLALAAREVPLVLATALVARFPRLLESDGDRLAAALHLPALAAAAAFEFAMRI